MGKCAGNRSDESALKVRVNNFEIFGHCEKINAGRSEFVYNYLGRIMKITDIPALNWIKGRKDVKILRHRAPYDDLWRLRRDGGFQEYQDGQTWDIFGTATLLVSFIAERNRYAKFVGVWKVNEKRAKPSGGYEYKTTELPGYFELEARLIVDWGSGTRSWAQWLRGAGDKKVFELLPPNSVMYFPGFYNIVLTHEELALMIANPDSNREWQRMLSSVSGVYVLIDQGTGKQYIGSAYGTGGVWARWASYARSPSGGNVLLKELLAKEPLAHKRFQFALLRVLESGATRDEVLVHEALIKRKLGSRAFGLNK